MLNLYRRHTKSCTKGFPESDKRQNCTCTVWVMGQLGEEFLRRSTGTRNLTRARVMLVEAEARQRWNADSAPRTSSKPLTEAITEYLAECSNPRGRDVQPATLSKYRTLLTRLDAFCAEAGILGMAEIDYAILHGFRNTWSTGAQATANNVARLRSFWKFARKMHWVSEDISQELEMPRQIVNKERLPFTDRELKLILNAARTIEFDQQQTVTNAEVETFIQLMIYSGMGISDAALFRKSELVRDEARFYRKKTLRSPRRRQVIVPLPQELVSRLKSMPVYHGTYLFCKGSDKLVSVVDCWHSRLRKVFAHAGIPDGTSHRFRHTAANTWLKNGLPLEAVSKLLGHASIKVTQQAYEHMLEDRIKINSDLVRNLYTPSSEATN